LDREKGGKVEEESTEIGTDGSAEKILQAKKEAARQNFRPWSGGV